MKLTNIHIDMENGHRNSRFTYQKLWFSIVFGMFAGMLPVFTGIHHRARLPGPPEAPGLSRHMAKGRRRAAEAVDDLR